MSCWSYLSCCRSQRAERQARERRAPERLLAARPLAGSTGQPAHPAAARPMPEHSSWRLPPPYRTAGRRKRYKPTAGHQIADFELNQQDKSIVAPISKLATPSQPKTAVQLVLRIRNSFEVRQGWVAWEHPAICLY